jgi:hyperosmotically inducible periplasmic protein
MRAKPGFVICGLALAGLSLLVGCRRTEEGVEVDRQGWEEAREDAAERGRDAMDEAGAMIGDATITARIIARLAADRDVSALDIRVETEDGVVTLEGVVAREEQRARAEQLARDTSGVTRVDNRIEVDPAREDPDDDDRPGDRPPPP